MRRVPKALLGLTALAAIVRFATIDVQSFWVDEGLTVGVVDQDLGGMLDRIPERESNPPLYYLLIWVWAKVAGTGEVALRAPSAVFGTLAVPVVYAIAERVASRRAGLVAAGLTALSPIMVWYSQEARGYALVVLLTALALLFCVRALDDPGRPREIVAWGVASALALATHYFAAFVVVPMAAVLYARARPRRAVVVAIAGVTAVGLALVPLAAHQTINGSGRESISAQSLPIRTRQVLKQFVIAFDTWAETLLFAGAVGLIALAVWFLVTRATAAERRRALALEALGAIAVAGPLLLDAVVSDVVVTRIVITAWVPLAIGVAVGLGTDRAGRAGIAAAVALCLVGAAALAGVASDGRYQRDDWRGVAEAVEDGPRAAAVVLPRASARPALDLYVPRLSDYPAGGAAVREIDVVDVVTRGAGEEPEVRRVEAGPPPGFAVAGREDTDSYSVVRLRAAEPVPVPRAVLEAMRPGGAVALAP